MYVRVCSLLEEQIIGNTHNVLCVYLHVAAIKTKTELSVSGIVKGTVFSPLSWHFSPLPLRKPLSCDLMSQEGRVTLIARWFTDKAGWQTKRKYLLPEAFLGLA